MIRDSCIKYWIAYPAAAFFLVLTSLAHAQENRSSGFHDFNVYPFFTDINSDNAFTFNSARVFNNRLSYFSLTNFGNIEESVSYYTEQNLRWKLTESSPLDLTYQANFRSGANNNRHRLGVRWRLNDTKALSGWFNAIHLNYSINWHPIQFDHEASHVWQLEHVFRFSFPTLSDRLYLAGFVDHTFNQDLSRNLPKNPIVAEAQLGYRFFEGFFLVGEYRINQYRRSDVNNFAIGIEYKVSW